MKPEVRNPRWWLRHGIKRSSVNIQDSNEIPTAIPMFLRSSNTTEILRRIPDVRIGDKLKWLPISGSRYEITHISASIHDRNEIPTAIPMFSRSGDTTKLLRRLSDVRIRGKSKMAAINRTSI